MQLIAQLIQLGPAIFIFMELLEPMLLKFVKMDRILNAQNMKFESKINNFDFIIVGGGSAGCNLASRLSERYSVLLIEAGGLPSPLLQIPILSYLLNNQKPIDFAHRTVPQSMAAWGLNNNVSHWPAGRQLGGSSTINGLIYIRGNVQGFDDVSKKTGDGRWSMENVLSYYKKIENYNGWFHNENAHGKEGEMSIEPAYVMPYTNHLLQAGVELGYKIRDPNNNGPYTEGLAPTDFYLKNGRRADAFSGSLENIMKNRPNLVVRKFSYVTKIIFEGNKAIGVRYERHKKMFNAWAKKEIILSAGVIQTPKILMLSGIGPSNHLTEMGIKTKVNLPVGQSLQDKYGALMGPFIVKDGYSFVRKRDIRIPSLLGWYFSGTGPLAAARTDAIHAIISNFSKSRGNTDVPDIHTYVISSSTESRTQQEFEKAFNFNPSSLNYFNQALGRDSFLQLVTLSRPKGMGYIKLKDKNPHSPLIIDPKYLQNKDDVEALVEGMKFAVKLVEETNSMKSIGGHLMRVPYPGCEMYLFKSHEYYECLARHATITAYKYCGTAPIGRDIDEPGSVVDSPLRVFGIKNLRVADASVLQLKYTSENDATVRMLGQLASDIIMDDHENTENFIFSKK